MHKLNGIIYLISALLYLGCGIVSYKTYEKSWWKSRERKLNPEATGPSEKYIRDRKLGGNILFVLTAISLVLGIVQLSIAHTDGKPLSIDGEEMKFPCRYEDIQAMGYELVEGQKIEEIKGTQYASVRNGKAYKVVNDKGQEFEIRFENNTPDIQLATDCYIYEMTFQYVAPYNMYEEMNSSSYLLYSQYEDLGMSQEEIEESIEDINQKASDFEERNKPMNSPKIRLDNGVTSQMDEDDIKSIMGEGVTTSGYSTIYEKSVLYAMEYGDEKIVVKITYNTYGREDEIQEITIAY